MQVTLSGGERVELAEFRPGDLERLQFEQERAFAERIKAAAKGTTERQAAVREGYDTVCTIRREMQADGEALSMGLDRRYVRLVLDVLGQRRFHRSGTPCLFEIGYGGGGMLAAAARAGYDVAGVEVSPAVRSFALQHVPEEYHEHLLTGDLCTLPLDDHVGRYDLVYWNDVLEHVPPDELGDSLQRIRSLLIKGGCLITITPNWHERPCDVTADFCPPRTEAMGLHLREYTLGEVTRLLQEHGFARVRTPLVVTPWRIVLAGDGLAGVKRTLEPILECLPYRAAVLACHVLGLSYTIATKG